VELGSKGMTAARSAGKAFRKSGVLEEGAGDWRQHLVRISFLITLMLLKFYVFINHH
jgi:hypothetical protein